MGKWCLSRSRLRKRFTIFIQQTAGPRSSILSGLGLVSEDNSLKVNGVMSLLYKCPLYVFLARHKLHYLDYIAGNYEVEVCLEDYQLSEDYSDSPVLSASPCGMTASGWVKHIIWPRTSLTKLSVSSQPVGVLSYIVLVCRVSGIRS